MLRSSQARAMTRAGMSQPMPLLRGLRPGQALRRLRRTGGDRTCGPRRRTRRPDRPQRLRQEHAGELHVRHAAPRDGQRPLRRPDARTACPRMSARGLAWRAASSCRGRSTRCRWRRICASRSLYAVNARRGAALGATRDRRALRGTAATWSGWRTRRTHLPTRPDADRNAQAGTGARHGGGAAAADRRRGDGRAVARAKWTTSWRC